MLKTAIIVTATHRVATSAPMYPFLPAKSQGRVSSATVIR
jgi:hypothetical protein